MYGNVFPGQVLDHRVRAAFAQFVVVVCRTHRIRVAFHHHDVTLGVGDFSHELIQSFLGFRGQVRFVKAEVDRGLNHGMIAIEIGDLVRQGVHAVRCLRSQSLCLVGAGARVHGLLVGCSGLLVHTLDTLLGAAVYITDAVGVLGGKSIKLIGFIDNGLGLLPHVILCGAAGTE